MWDTLYVLFTHSFYWNYQQSKVIVKILQNSKYYNYLHVLCRSCRMTEGWFPPASTPPVFPSLMPVLLSSSWSLLYHAPWDGTDLFSWTPPLNRWETEWRTLFLYLRVKQDQWSQRTLRVRLTQTSFKNV